MQGKLERSLGYALVRAFRAANRATNRALLPHKLSAEQAHILLALWIEGPMKVGELQRILALGSGTLTGALDRMDKAGLVRRVADPEDGRAWRVEPAPLGRSRRVAIEKTLEDVEKRAFSGLTKDERGLLLGLLRKLDDGD
jgi:DNA-binding MarR family transcriptional regulator